MLNVEIGGNALQNYAIHTIDQTISYHYEDPLCLNGLASRIYQLMLDMNSNFQREIIYMCIGTDRATGDCLGPLVGTRLQSLSPEINLFGSLEKPAHALNLKNVLQEIISGYDNPLVVAVDASLGNIDKVGYINIKPGGLKPGTALNKFLPSVGDFHISAVVNLGGYLEPMVLQNTRLYVVYQMADLIARSISLAHFRFDCKRKNFSAPI